MTLEVHSLHMATSLPITIRPAYGDDTEALHRLAILDSAPEVPAGPLLLAEVDGELQAALALRTGAVIADPFRPTASLVALLRQHAARTTAPAGRRSWRPRLRSPVVLHPARPAA